MPAALTLSTWNLVHYDKGSFQWPGGSPPYQRRCTPPMPAATEPNPSQSIPRPSASFSFSNSASSPAKLGLSSSCKSTVAPQQGISSRPRLQDPRAASRPPTAQVSGRLLWTHLLEDRLDAHACLDRHGPQRARVYALTRGRDAAITLHVLPATAPGGRANIGPTTKPARVYRHLVALVGTTEKVRKLPRALPG